MASSFTLSKPSPHIAVTHISAPVEILLVEDNPGDVELTQDAFQDLRIPNRLHVVHDGDEALEYLLRRGRFTDAVRPDLILLDLNMPGKNGKEVLAIIKADVNLKTIPVIILTSSEAERDIARCYELQANAYVVKPMDLESFLRVVMAIEMFWLSVARLVPQVRKAGAA